MTEATLGEGWQRDLPAERRPLPGGFSLLSLTPPVALLAAEHEGLRRAIVAVSDAAFGRPTAGLWRDKFSAGFLGRLTRFYLLADPAGGLVGWSGYRARTIAGERIVYFTSTGLLPRCQGAGLIAAVQRLALEAEARGLPLQRVTLVIRTRNPHAYRLMARTFGTDRVIPQLDGGVPIRRRPLVAAVASWLGLPEVDPATAVVSRAYPIEGGLYGREPRSGHQGVDDLFARLCPQDALLVMGSRSRA